MHPIGHSLQLDHVLSDMVSEENGNVSDVEYALQLDHVLSDMVSPASLTGSPPHAGFNWTMSFQTW